MRGLPGLLSTSWATENAVMALFLDPLMLGRWLQHAARHPWEVVRCSALQRMVDLDEQSTPGVFRKRTVPQAFLSSAV
jgi:hypothetical protein